MSTAPMTGQAAYAQALLDQARHSPSQEPAQNGKDDEVETDIDRRRRRRDRRVARPTVDRAQRHRCQVAKDGPTRKRHDGRAKQAQDDRPPPRSAHGLMIAPAARAAKRPRARDVSGWIYVPIWS